jgi:hypothetical protein
LAVLRPHRRTTDLHVQTPGRLLRVGIHRKSPCLGQRIPAVTAPFESTLAATVPVPNNFPPWMLSPCASVRTPSTVVHLTLVQSQK